MTNNQIDKNEEHHDGILELDNDLPNWWLIIFFVTIAYSVVYMGYYHLGNGTLPVQAYLEEQASDQAKVVNQKPSDDVEDLAAALANPEKAAAGKVLYDAKCAACHGPGGGGVVGPNLTDDHWLHGGKPEQIAQTISKGVPAKGMLAWETILAKKEITELVAYIKSINGSNPPNAKAPEGNKE